VAIFRILQIDLKLDYKRNIARYPLHQDYFRRRQSRLLAIWGKTTRSSRLIVRKRSGAISPQRTSFSSIPAILHLRRKARRSQTR
jgi:hypothetical protein